MSKRLLLSACVLIFFIWAINSLANMFYWYSAMWWFDIPMHILGGAFLALLLGAIFFKKLISLNKKEITITILLGVVIVGAGWEVFEYVVQHMIKGLPLANFPDSIKDMLMDIIGGFLASFFVLKAVKRYNTSHAITNL
jgi:hypothetical protein